MADQLEMLEETDKSLSRRNFIKGVIAGGAATYSAGYLFRTGTVRAQSGAAGSVERLITLRVNGQERRVDVMKQETLAMTLRYKLGLTGTKMGCDRAECGSCTVLLDGTTYYSCSVLTHSVRGREVITIEGLADTDGTLHPVQQAVVDGAGFQCAFCAPRFHHQHGRDGGREPESDARGGSGSPCGQSLPLLRLQQNPRLRHERRRIHAGGLTWPTENCLEPITRRRISSRK